VFAEFGARLSNGSSPEAFRYRRQG